MNLILLFQTEHRALVRQVNRIVHNAAVAEELTQEAFMRVQAAMSAGRVDRIEPFLRRTARNLAIDHRRQLVARDTVDFTTIGEDKVSGIPDRKPDSESELIDRQRLQLLRKALAGLPERAQKVLLLNRLEGLTHEEIASRLGISQRTVFNDLRQALDHCSLATKRHEG